MRLVESTESGRPIIWLSRWSWYGGKASGYCCFMDKVEAIKYAIGQARGYVDWPTFPDPAKKYPNDDRDGSNVPELTPVFIATWGEGDEAGSVEVIKTEVCGKYNWAADYLMKQVEEIYAGLPQPIGFLASSIEGKEFIKELTTPSGP